MPMLKIKTNLDASKFDEAFLKEMTTTMAGLVGKPEQYIAVIVSGGKTMSFGGSTEPCALVSFESIGGINEEKNSTYATAIFKALNAKGLKSDRIYISFANLLRDNVAWNGKLFSQ